MITIFSFVSASILIISVLAKLFRNNHLGSMPKKRGLTLKYLSEKPRKAINHEKNHYTILGINSYCIWHHWYWVRIG